MLATTALHRYIFVADAATNSVYSWTKVSLLEAEAIGYNRPEVVDEWNAQNLNNDAKKVGGTSWPEWGAGHVSCIAAMVLWLVLLCLDVRACITPPSSKYNAIVYSLVVMCVHTSKYTFIAAY